MVTRERLDFRNADRWAVTILLEAHAIHNASSMAGLNSAKC